MSKLIALLLNNSKSGLLISTTMNSSSKQLHLVRTLVTKSKMTAVVVPNSIARRFLASDSSANKATAPKQAATSSSAQNELDKPEWERSTRFRIFYGYDYKDEAVDKALAHFITFLGLVGFLFVPFFFIYYYPDFRTNDWCHREAYIELARREAAGEPLVNPDYIPSERIKLPSEEELGDTEIII